MDNKKLIKTARMLDTIVKVGGGIFRAVGFVCLIFAVLVVIFGSRMFVEGSLTLDLDFLKLHLADDFQAITGFVKLYAIVGLLVGGVLCFMMHYIAGLLRKILVPMKSGRPFEADAPKNLRRIAWTILAGGIVSQVLGIVERIFMIRAYPMESVFSPDVVAKVEYVFTMDFDFVLLFGVVMLLSYIFSYGQALQKESDETL